MVSTLGLLDKGEVSLDGRVACPKNFTVDGRSFKNSNNFALGDVPFRVDFAKSCNTAFAALAPKLGDDGLAEAGRSLGLEGAWDLGVDAFSGKVSTGGSRRRAGGGRVRAGHDDRQPARDGVGDRRGRARASGSSRSCWSTRRRRSPRRPGRR